MPSRKNPKPAVMTLAEANEALPKVQDLLEHIQQLRQTIAEGAEEQEELNRQLEGGPAAAKGKLMDRLHAGLAKQDQLVAEAEAAFDVLTDFGAMIKDLDGGLIDFYGERDGEVIFLCWRLGEAHRIQHWHTLEGGFDGRQPVDTRIK